MIRQFAIDNFLTPAEQEAFDYHQAEKQEQREEEEMQLALMNRKQRRAYKAQQRKAKK